jgi:hypothetical protein
MAENALYSYDDEPFPFDAVRPRITWLQSYLDNSIEHPSYDMETFIATILVFGRARTATLQGRFWWPEINDLVKRLNSVLQSVGASQHKLELVLRGAGFFVTCSRSPRFIWKTQLTHRHVGHNLDFFAPGNLGATEPAYAVQFIETESLQVVMAECVLAKTLENEATRREFDEFNKKRVDLYNSTMENLGLRYRFKCAITFRQDIDAEISRVLASSTPPQQSWWTAHWSSVNGSFITDTNMNSIFAYCEEESDYEAYWTVIQMIHKFLAKYGRDEYWYKFEETGHAYWTSVEALCRRIRTRLSSGQASSPGDIAMFIDQTKGEIGEFAAQADAPNKAPDRGDTRQRPYYPQRFRQLSTRWQLRGRKIKFRFRYVLQLVQMYLLEWYKFNNRRVRQEIESLAIADQPAFRPFH